MFIAVDVTPIIINLLTDNQHDVHLFQSLVVMIAFIVNLEHKQKIKSYINAQFAVLISVPNTT